MMLRLNPDERLVLALALGAFADKHRAGTSRERRQWLARAESLHRALTAMPAMGDLIVWHVFKCPNIQSGNALCADMLCDFDLSDGESRRRCTLFVGHHGLHQSKFYSHTATPKEPANLDRPLAEWREEEDALNATLPHALAEDGLCLHRGGKGIRVRTPRGVVAIVRRLLDGRLRVTCIQPPLGYVDLPLKADYPRYGMAIADAFPDAHNYPSLTHTLAPIMPRTLAAVDVEGGALSKPRTRRSVACGALRGGWPCHRPRGHAGAHRTAVRHGPKCACAHAEGKPPTSARRCNDPRPQEYKS